MNKKRRKSMTEMNADILSVIANASISEVVILQLAGLPPATVTNGIFVRKVNDDAFTKILFDDIEWIEANGSYTHFHLKQNICVTVAENIGKVEEVLPKRMFVRASRSEIVNIHKVTNICGNLLDIRGHKTHVTGMYIQTLFNCLPLLN